MYNIVLINDTCAWLNDYVWENQAKVTHKTLRLYKAEENIYIISKIWW